MSILLTAVAFVLRHHPARGALEHLEGTICSFLGPSPNLSLSQACSFDSLPLLDWIWASSCTSSSDRTRGWSLSNYLRSDVHYNRYQFRKCMKVAANGGDLEMVKWLFGHFSGCNVPWEATTAAAEGGNLLMLQFLLANDAERQETEESEGREKRGVETREAACGDGSERVGGGHVVAWGGPFMMSRAEKSGHPAVAKWLRENVFEGEEPEEQVDEERGILDALNNGEDELAKTLMPPGRCVLDYAHQCSRLDLIELILDCGYIRRDRGCANSSIRRLAGTGRLDLMQQVVLLHSPPAQDAPLCLHDWHAAIRTACGNGYLAMLQWLLEHPLGQILCDDMRRQRNLFELVCLAADNDRTDVMQYVYDIGARDELSDVLSTKYAALLDGAVRNGQTNTVKWLVEHIRFPEHCYDIIDTATIFGHLNILKLFHEMVSPEVIDLTQSGQNQSGQVTAWWAQSGDSAVDIAASAGYLELLQWLLSNNLGKCTASTMDRAADKGKLDIVAWLHANRLEGCTTAAMDGAAAFGHLKIVKWLHANRSEGCTTAAMDQAAARGHLDIVKWLHANRSEGCTAAAMDQAVASGHLDVMKWLYANRSIGCTPLTIRIALRNGRLSVANWMHMKYPEVGIAGVKISMRMENVFEVVIFLQKNFPNVVTPLYAKSLKSTHHVAPFQPDMFAWLAEICSS